MINLAECRQQSHGAQGSVRDAHLPLGMGFIVRFRWRRPPRFRVARLTGSSAGHGVHRSFSRSRRCQFARRVTLFCDSRNEPLGGPIGSCWTSFPAGHGVDRSISSSGGDWCGPPMRNFVFHARRELSGQSAVDPRPPLDAAFPLDMGFIRCFRVSRHDRHRRHRPAGRRAGVSTPPASTPPGSMPGSCSATCCSSRRRTWSPIPSARWRHPRASASATSSSAAAGISRCRSCWHAASSGASPSASPRTR